MKTALGWALALNILFPSTMVCAGSLPAGFTIGYNEAWIQGYYQTWLATDSIPAMWNLPSNFNSSLVEAMFSGMAQGNAKIVRIWLFPNMQGVDIDPSASPQTLGLLPTGCVNTDITKCEIIANLNKVFQLAIKYNLQLYITALDANSMRAVAGSTNTLHTYYQRLISNTGNELSSGYEQNVLAPILNWIADPRNIYNGKYYKDAVYAFDLINEIEAALNAGYFSNYWSGARSWISNMAYAITYYYPWLPVTSTAGWGNAVQEVTLGLFSGLHLNFYDVHVYSDSGSYSGQTALCNKAKSDKLPIILGEFGQSTSTESDSIQNISTSTFLTKANGSCFSSALAWKYDGASNPCSLAPCPAGEPQYSFLKVNTDGTLLNPPTPLNPSCASNQVLVAGYPNSYFCARPAYTTIKNFH